ncbi:ATP synthase F1 subunit epsilon [Acidithiobacillus sulfuriphilus]|uniref:ATP synthase epsilon chain n=2 Tax=Acidithiobacillus sulfuriphilus TaxID=1867749 RepID=A0A3M8QV28_9PROT|nr:ATP synthase F1 subunit epsilon [Acidithiobacillus sulfuriphilus]RNF59521.1 ATP synthase F1 subunit epsilon [Acidithiobacillus sulfuriphilus]
MAHVPTFRLHVVDVHGEVYNGDARFVAVPAEMGEVGILPGHAPLLSRMRPGELRISQGDGALQILFLDGGMLEVQPYLVSILADASLRVPDIDLKDTEARLQAAQRALSERTSEMNLLMAEQELKRELAKIQAHQRYQQNLQLGKTDGYDWRRPPLTGIPEINIQDLEE